MGTSTFDDFLNDNTFGDGGGEDGHDDSLKDGKIMPNYLQPANSSTPGGSSTASDDKWIAKANPYISPNSEEDRRISVSSLLSNSPEPEERPKVQTSVPIEDR